MGHHKKEAKEVMEDAGGRWYSFALTKATPILLEKKDLGDHLKELPCADNVVPLSSVWAQLEDAGEAWCQSPNTFASTPSTLHKEIQLTNWRKSLRRKTRSVKRTNGFCGSRTPHVLALATSRAGQSNDLILHHQHGRP